MYFSNPNIKNESKSEIVAASNTDIKQEIKPEEAIFGSSELNIVIPTSTAILESSSLSPLRNVCTFATTAKEHSISIDKMNVDFGNNNER